MKPTCEDGSSPKGLCLSESILLSGHPFCQNWNHKFPLDNNHNQALEDEEAREARDKVDGEGDVEDVVARVKL